MVELQEIEMKKHQKWTVTGVYWAEHIQRMSDKRMTESLEQNKDGRIA